MTRFFRQGGTTDSLESAVFFVNIWQNTRRTQKQTPPSIVFPVASHNRAGGNRRGEGGVTVRRVASRKVLRRPPLVVGQQVLDAFSELRHIDIHKFMFDRKYGKVLSHFDG